MQDASNPVDPKIGPRNMLRALGGLLLIIVLGAGLLHALTDLGVLASLLLSAFGTLALQLALGAPRWWRGFRARGRVLWDGGRNSMGLLFMANGLGFLSLAVWKLSSPETDLTTLLMGAGLGLGALFFFGMSLTRFQVVEGGLWYFGELLRWEDIRVYRWTLDSTLWLEFNRRPGLLGPHRAAIEVPPELRGEIDAILVGLNVPRGAEVGGEAPLPGGGEQPPAPPSGSSLTGR